MFEGRLMAIIVCPQAGAPLEEVPEVEAIAGRGLAGDRYSAGRGAGQRRGPEPNKAITLIEREAIEAAARDYDLRIVHRITRRNLLTEGVPLNHLVGREFVVGEATLRGVELCEPCSYLERLTVPGIEKALRHRGGLRAEIVDGGMIRAGDVIRPAGG